MGSFISIFKMDIKNLFKNPVLVGYNSIFFSVNYFDHGIPGKR